MPQHLSHKNLVRTDSRSHVTNHTRYTLITSLTYYCYTSHLLKKNTVFSHTSYTFNPVMKKLVLEFLYGLLLLKEKAYC